MVRFRLVITGCVVLVAFSLSTRAQIPDSRESQGGSILDKAQPLDTVAQVFAPPVDLAAVHAEDDLRRQQGLPHRFAIGNDVTIRPETHGTWETIGDALLWRLRVTSPGALSINFGFTRYLMPADGRLSVYAADGSYRIRPFTGLDNASHGELWTPIVPSDDVVIEVTIPADARRLLGLELGSINVGYRGLGTSRTAQMDASAPASGSCNVDVICPEGDGWRDQIQSSGVYTIGGSWTCSGAMVNNTAQDATPYFLTAEHCQISSANAASVTVYWNYQNSTCRPPGSAASGGPGNGSLAQFQTGAFFRAEYVPADMTLIEMDSDPDPAWEVSFSGWDNSGADATSAVAIHHPNTDEKRISFENDATTTTSYFGTSSPGDGTHVRVLDWDVGTTEPGSSGSPLYDQNQRIIGQLHGGWAACSNHDPDWYGKFSASWTGGGSNSSRLSNWLDPLGTGATVLDLLSGGGLTVTPSAEVLHVGNVGGPFTNPTVTYTLGNPSSNPIDYSVSLTSSFGILLDGGTGPVTGTLAGGGGSVDVIVTLGPGIDALAAGLYVEEIVFDDLTNGRSHTRQHSFEIGFTTFTVTPTTGLDSGGPVGGPFPGSVVYTVTSDRPTPVAVEISVADPWISLNGGTGPVTLNLNGTGAFDTVTVTISPTANALAAGIYNGDVTFANLSGGTGDTTRGVSLDVGRTIYPSTDTPQPVADNTATASTITLVDNFCVGDVNVDIDITHTYIADLTVDLISPSGTVVRLHNRTGGATDNIVQLYDDEGIPPNGPGALSDFDLESGAGDWVLVVTDNATGDSGTLNSWALRIAPVGGDCPTPVVAYTFPLDIDPGWTTEGQWAFGQPTGQGSGNGDPTAGHTGTNVYGYNLAGDYPGGMAATEYLTTTAIDCTRLAGTRVRFRRWLGIESSTFDHANLDVSADGVNWTAVWNHATTSTVSESTWSLSSHNISAVADGVGTVFLRWGMGPTDASVNYPGWNIDDIEITGVIQETDCNLNGVPDSEDIALGTSLDCNANLYPDECDLSSGLSSDCDADSIPDECSCPLFDAPISEAVVVAKNRVLSLIPQSPGCDTALQVTLVALPSPFNVYNGRQLWVGPPSDICENSGEDVPAPAGSCSGAPGFPNPSYKGATLQCSPHLMDWSSVGTLKLTHETIVPEGLYRIHAVLSACAGAAPGGRSTALDVSTNLWGDLVGPFDGGTGTWTAPDGVVGVPTDVIAILDKFSNRVGAPTKARADLQPEVPDLIINISDVLVALEAFRGADYPFAATWTPCTP